MSNEVERIEVESGGAVQPQAVRAPKAQSAGKSILWVVLGLAAVLAYVVYTGLHSRAKASTALQQSTLANAIPTVSVITPKLTEGAQEVVVPGNMQAFIDTPIWARTNGYLKNWYSDIGAHVKAGQLLATIESPETDQQLQGAREELTTAEANLKLAQITAERYNNLFKSDSVSKQEVDNAVQDAAAKTSTVKSAQANVRRFEEVVGYEKITAPFDGVITARNVDVGALVDAGANTPGKELFHLASTATLRTYVNVPEIYSRAARPGVPSYLTLTEFPGRQFTGIIVRNADSIDTSSRTLLVEVDVKNPTGELLPGSYVSVHLKLPAKVRAVTVPANTLLFRSEGLRVAVVRGDRVVLVPVTIGRDFGEEVELVSGIESEDRVVVDPSDSLLSGQVVRVAGGSGAKGS